MRRAVDEHAAAVLGHAEALRAHHDPAQATLDPPLLPQDRVEVASLDVEERVPEAAQVILEARCLARRP